MDEKSNTKYHRDENHDREVNGKRLVLCDAEFFIAFFIETRLRIIETKALDFFPQ